MYSLKDNFGHQSYNIYIWRGHIWSSLVHIKRKYVLVVVGHSLGFTVYDWWKVSDSDSSSLFSRAGLARDFEEFPIQNSQTSRAHFLLDHYFRWYLSMKVEATIVFVVAITPCLKSIIVASLFGPTVSHISSLVD